MSNTNDQQVNTWGWRYENAANPANPIGTSVIPGASNAEGAWTQIATGANIANNVYGFKLIVNAGNLAATSRMHLLDVGVDTAGGTSYTAKINNIPCGSAAGILTGCIEFYFPLFIKSGSTVAVRVQGLQATAGTVRAAATFYGMPSRPEAVRVGQYAETVGTVTSSNGVSFTPGNTAAEGTWVSLGTTARPLWYWQLGVQADNSVTVSQLYFIDLAYGDATNKHIIIANMKVILPGTSEIVQIYPPHYLECFREVPSGATLYVRGSGHATADTGWNALAIGIGG